jgi:Protein of unknown function (DUF1761)
MFNVIGQINWLAVAAATLATAALGALWFTALFGRYYAQALGREGQAPPAMKPIFIAGPFLCGLVTCIASAVLIETLKVDTIGDAIRFGFIVGLGFLATTTVNTGINPNIPRPMLYGLISGSYFLITGIIISIMLVMIG